MAAAIRRAPPAFSMTFYYLISQLRLGNANFPQFCLETSCDGKQTFHLDLLMFKKYICSL